MLLFRLHQLQPIRRPRDLPLTNQKPGWSVSFLPDAPVAQSSYWCEPEQSRAAPSCLGARTPWRHRPGPAAWRPGLQLRDGRLLDNKRSHWTRPGDALLSLVRDEGPEGVFLSPEEARAKRLALLLALVRVTHCVSS